MVVTLKACQTGGGGFHGAVHSYMLSSCVLAIILAKILTPQVSVTSLTLNQEHQVFLGLETFLVLYKTLSNVSTVRDDANRTSLH